LTPIVVLLISRPFLLVAPITTNINRPSPISKEKHLKVMTLQDFPQSPLSGPAGVFEQDVTVCLLI